MIGAEPDLTGLVRRVAAGDRGAFAEFYDATSARVYGFVMKMLRDASRAEEVLQDVYLQAWRRAAEFDDARGNPLAWIAVIARSRALDRLRRDRARGEHELSSGWSLDSLIDSAQAPEETDHGRSRRLRQALATLPAPQQRALALAYYQGMSHSEIAAATGLPLGTVKTHIRSALMRLRDALREDAG